MKKYSGALISSICFILLFFTVVFEKAAEYTNGDIISMGSYPQTHITDEELIFKLDNEITDCEWQSMKYYENNTESDYGIYFDFTFENIKYRAVKFSEYRPLLGSGKAGENSSVSSYGYLTDVTYYFRFDELNWQIIDADKGLLLCVNAIDAMPISNTVFNNYYKDEALSVYTNNYAESDIREWLNRDFIDTAFSESDKTALLLTELNNDAYYTDYSQYSSDATTDYVFIPSYNDMNDAAYSFSTSDLLKPVSDYAKMQGYANYESIGGNYAKYCYWWLRTPGRNGNNNMAINPYGNIEDELMSTGCDTAVVPCIRVDFAKIEENKKSPYDGIIFDFDENVLTVSGNGIIPNAELDSENILTAFNTAKVLIIEEGITEISSNAFENFSELEMIVISGNIKINDGAFPQSKGIKDIFTKNIVTLTKNSFNAASAYYFEKEGYSHYGELSDNITAHTYSFDGETVKVSGSITMDTYRLLDFISLLCADGNTVNYLSFDSFSSEDITFGTYNELDDEVVKLDEQTLSNPVFSVKIFDGTKYNSISFNELSEMVTEQESVTFILTVKAENAEEIEDSVIAVAKRIFYTALKFIVSLLNRLFKFFGRK